MSEKTKIEFDLDHMTVADLKKAVKTLRIILESHQQLTVAVNINGTLSYEDACDELMYTVGNFLEEYEV